MKLTIQYHAGNPNMCRIPELTIRQMPECEGGGWYLPREQAELLVRASEGYEDTTVDELDPQPTWQQICDYWRTRALTSESGRGLLQIPADSGPAARLYAS